MSSTDRGCFIHENGFGFDKPDDIPTTDYLAVADKKWVDPHNEGRTGVNVTRVTKEAIESFLKTTIAALVNRNFQLQYDKRVNALIMKVAQHKVRFRVVDFGQIQLKLVQKLSLRSELKTHQDEQDTEQRFKRIENIFAGPPDPGKWNELVNYLRDIEWCE